MLLDDRIHKHIDDMDKIEERVDREIQSVLQSLDIDELLESPEDVLMEAVEEFRKILVGEILDESVSLGVKFAKEVKKAKEDLVIADTENANLNKEIANV